MRTAAEICASKRAYRTKAIALQSASTAKKVFRNAGELTAYKCSACKEWHLTSMPKVVAPQFGKTGSIYHHKEQA